MSTQVFPTDIYRQLDGYDFRILDELAFLCKQQQKRTGAAYCCPGREYLAAKTGCDVGTVSRHTTKLEKLGLLEKIQRRPVRGQWRSCLYRLRSWVSWRLGQVAGMLRKVGKAKAPEKITDRVRSNARLASPERNSNVRPPLVTSKPPPNAEQIATKHPILALWLHRE